MPSSLRQRIRAEDGFTLTELLLVIVILAILMTMAVPSYLGRRVAAQDVVAQTDARSLLRFVEACATERGGYVADTVCGGMPGIGEAYSGETAPANDPSTPENETAVWFHDLTHLRYGWFPGEVELDPCTENQQDQNPAADPSWSCAPGEDGFFIIAKSHSGNFFYLRKIIGSGAGIEQLCTASDRGDCSSSGTW